MNETRPTLTRKHRRTEVVCRAATWADRNVVFVAAVILMVSLLPILSVIQDPPQPDVYVYLEVANQIEAGKVPYKDFVLEYPPYAIPLFLLPVAFGPENYALGFKLLVGIADTLIKFLLLSAGLREAKGIRALLPVTAYCIAVPFINHFFLQRYDALPAFLTAVSIGLFCSRKYALCGLLVLVGAGIKVFPILLAPPLFVLAWRAKNTRRFVMGLVIGAIPMLLSGLFFPWWQFLAFHRDRGLQAESLSASIIWFAHLLGVADARWESGSRCFEVHGAVADMILPWVRVWWVLATGLSTALVCWTAGWCKIVSISQIARLLLIPLVAFVVFNQVFSPQFMIWLLPLAALASVTEGAWITGTVSLTTMLTLAFYPSPEYHSGGLNLIQTALLLLRNVILVGMWVLLMGQVVVQFRNANGATISSPFWVQAPRA